MQMALVLLSTLHTWAVLFKCLAFQMVSSYWRKLILCPSCTRTSLISRPPSLPEPSHPHYLPTFFSNCVLLYAFLYRTSPCFLACTAHVILIIFYESLWSLCERAHGICPFGSVLSDFKYFFPNSIHFPASSFFFTAKYYPAMSVQTLIFHHLLPFPGPWIGQNEQAVIPVVGHRVLWVCAQSGMFLGPLQTDFQNGCSSYLSHRQCTKVPHFPNSAPALVLGVHDNCFC